MFAANLMIRLLCELACERIVRVLWWSGYADSRVHEVVFISSEEPVSVVMEGWAGACMVVRGKCIWELSVKFNNNLECLHSRLGRLGCVQLKEGIC